MLEERLSNLAVLSIERRLADSLSLDEVINKLAATEKKIVLS